MNKAKFNDSHNTVYFQQFTLKKVIKMQDKNAR